MCNPNNRSCPQYGDNTLGLASPQSTSPSSDKSSEDGEKSCPVCGKTAGKFCFYGSQCCNSCRAFFRRSVQYEKYKRFGCVKGSNKCVIDSTSWKSCQKCRFEKCLQAGMKPIYVLGNKEEAGKTSVRPKMAAVISVKNSPLQLRRPTERFTLEDEIFLLGLGHKQTESLQYESCKLYSQNYALSKKIFSDYKTSTPLSPEMVQLVEQSLVESMKGFYVQLGDMSNILPEDQSSLLDTNLPIIFEFFNASSIGNESVFRKYQEDYFGLLKKHECDPYVEFTSNLLKEVGFEDGSSFNIVSYKAYYPWQESKKEEGAIHEALLTKLAGWSIMRGKFDQTLLTLMSLLLLYSPEGNACLKNFNNIDKIRTKYTHILYKYLNEKYTHKEATSKLCEGMHLLSISQECYRMKKKHLYPT